MYGGAGGGGGGPPRGPPQQPPQPQGGGVAVPFPIPQGITQAHYHQYKQELTNFQQNRLALLNQALNRGQLTHEQFQQEVHNVNERIRGAMTQYAAQCSQRAAAAQQQQQQQNQAAGQMPPPQMAPVMMSAAEKKKQMEMQKHQRMAQQQQMQQQQGGMSFPPGSTLQQQQQQMRMQFQRQQQQQQQQLQQNPQNQGYGRMGGGPQYPGMQQQQQLTHQNPGMQQQQMQQPQMQQTPQSHGPIPVSNPSSAQQMQYYQQQQQQQLQLQQNQQMQMQQQQMQQHQQQHPGMGGPEMGGHMHAQQGAPGSQAAPVQQQQQIQQQAPPQAPAEKTEDMKYKELLKEMKLQYLEALQGMQRRQAQQKGLVQMVNILEGDRIVSYDHLLSLKTPLHRLMTRDCPTFPLMEEIRKVVFKKKEDREKAMLMSFVGEKDNLSAQVESADKRLSEQSKDDDPMGVKPWRSVKHLTIRVPDFVRNLTGNEDRKAFLKRPRAVSAEEDEAVVGAKKVKEEEQDDTSSQASEDEDISLIQSEFVIKTVFDSRKPWIVPPKAREELSNISHWNVDEHCLPSCSATPFIIVCIKSPSLLVNPLRISLPRTYPIDPATVQFDRTFPQDSEHGPVLQKLFEKNLGAKTTVRTMTDFVEAYCSACEEYQIFMPKYNNESSPEQSSQPGSAHSSQQQKTPEMAYHSRLPAAVSNPIIAQKGIVI